MFRTIQLITSNAGKAEEFNQLLQLPNFPIETLSIDLLEIQTANTDDLAFFKLSESIKKVSSPKQFLMVDDVSLAFDAMNGFPGPYIKWMLKAMKLNEIVDLVAPVSTKAKATCTIGLYDFATQKKSLFHGVVEGEIVKDTGQKGFGWDGIFRPKGSEKTFAEMSIELKNQTSHRAKAVEKLKAFLLQTGEPLPNFKKSF